MPMSSSEPEAFGKLDYIDALRGIAILMVIASHVSGTFSDLPWPIKKFTTFGWHGVQLFFIASAVTLMMSWVRSRDSGFQKVQGFFLRRLFRIVPMYFFGALIYAILTPPLAGFDLGQLIRYLTFTNAWSPDWISTTGRWNVVPGGWSIGVEFTFYLIFPLIATVVKTVSRAAFAIFLSIIFAAFVNGIMRSTLLAGYSVDAVDQFLYYWFPSQLFVFCCGIGVFHLINDRRVMSFLGQRAAGFVFIFLISLAGLTQNFSMPNYISIQDPFPRIIVTVFLFSGLVLLLACGFGGFLVNRITVFFGKISFSGYVLHFLPVSWLGMGIFSWIDLGSSGLFAIAWYCVAFLIVALLTALGSEYAYRWIEVPGIEIGKRLIQKSRSELKAA